MREIDPGKDIAKVARMYQLSPKRLETWKGEWRAKGELASWQECTPPSQGWMPSGSRS